ncbi:MAG: methyl-accepting chemotaxis protein, partial [Marinobacter sp.]
MGLLDRATIFWGSAITIFLAIASGLVASLLGLDPASMVIGLAIGLGAAVAFLIVRVMEPVDRGLVELNDGTLDENHPLRSRCEQLLANAQAGKALVGALSGSADKNAISAAQVSYAADQLKLQLDRQVQETAQMADYAGQITETVRESSQQATEASTMALQNRQASTEGRQALT